MSVLEYIYPRVETELSLDTLIPALQADVPGVVLQEIESARHSLPNWKSLVFGHPNSSKFSSLIERIPNSKSNVRDLCEKYRTQKNLLVVKQASTLYWSKQKMGAGQLAKMTAACRVHDRILLTIVRLSRGVIDLPENEKLYSATGFARYVRSLA